MRTSFHHQPEAQHPIFQLSTSWQADYPIFRGQTGKRVLILSITASNHLLTPKRSFGSIHSTARWKRGIIPPLHE